MKQGFTLAEVFIIILIIFVVFALFLPTWFSEYINTPDIQDTTKYDYVFE